MYYSTVSAPTSFISLATVNFNPSVADNTPSCTKVDIGYSSGVLATNVAAVKFDFTNPGSENGYCGYAELTVFGTPSAVQTVPISVGSIVSIGPEKVVVNVSGLSTSRNYWLQSTTNLLSGNWFTETNFVPQQSAVTLTNSVSTRSQKFYRLVTY